jgi:hypothetical protein
MDILQFIGGIGFGLVVGWVTYFILRRAQPKTLSDLSTFIGIVGGGTITALFDPGGYSFAGYSIGLAIGFFAYYIVFMRLTGSHAVGETMIIKKKVQKPAQVPDSGIMGEKRPSSHPAGPAEEEEEIVWGVKKRSD